MVYSEHIDISENKLISKVLENKTIYSWEAIDSEKLGDWIPDIGLTSYFKKSIFRPHPINDNSDSKILSHRFWGTVENQSDHRGLKHVGVLFYLYHGETCPFELALGAESIGTYNPLINDNNHHLIITKDKVNFEGEMEVFQFKAKNNARYRIEKFILLDDIPESPVRELKIENFSFQLRISQNRKNYDVVVNFTTSEPSHIEIDSEFECQCPEKDKKKRNFKILFNNIIPGKNLNFKVKAHSIFGNKAFSQQSYKAEINYSNSKDLKIPIYKNLTAGFIEKNFVVGVPFQEGQFLIGEKLKVDSNGVNRIVDYQPISFWSDGSIKWIRVFLSSGDFRKDVCFLNKSARSLQTDDYFYPEFTSRSKFKCGEYELKFIENQPVVIENDRFSLNFVESFLILPNEKSYLSDQISNLKVLNQNDENSDLYFEMVLLENGEFEVKVKFFVNISTIGFVKIQCILTINALSTHNKDKGFNFETGQNHNEVNEILKIKEFKLKFPFLKIQSLTNIANENNDFHEFMQISDKLSKINKNNQSSSLNHLRFGDEFQLNSINESFFFYFKDFWQNYPKSIDISTGDFDIKILPDFKNCEFDFKEDETHRLGFWFDESNYLIKMGMSLSSSFLIDLSSLHNNLKDFKNYSEEVIACVDLDYLNSTKAYKYIQPKRDSLSEQYEKLMPRALTSFFDDRERNRAFGHMNFGDWYGESGFSWGNNEYDTGLCAIVEFLRCNNPLWWSLGQQAIRHQVDVDTISDHMQSKKIGSQAMHMPGHVGGYLPPYFKSKMKGTTSIPSHTWVEGLILYYLLSCDESVREAIDQTRSWLLQDEKLNFYDFSNCREAGWHLIHLCSYQEAFSDNECLNAASIIVEKVLVHQHEDGGWVRMLTESHCGCGFPRCSGEAGFMLSILLSGLSRYYHYTQSEEVKNAVVNGALWLIQNTFDHNSGQFRYTSCEKRSVGGGFQQTQWVIEGLSYAYFLSRNDVIRKYLMNAIDTIGKYPENLDHLGLGKAMAQQMRYTPFILHMLPK
ncbi:MAG: hypothetical protein P8O70_20340 [SAR324 cluster bacterium]|jgi:hypothetical protein|nr:hypothetical protein [SAR324 cluster bacterium]